MDENIKLLGEIIDLMRSRGVVINSPYDVQNWFADYAPSFEDYAATGRFPVEGEEEEEKE